VSEQSTQAGKYLTFRLAKEEYGVTITKVKEIIGMMDITQIPQCHDYMKGVINLRGSVIPVIDLRARFGMESVEATDRTCIIVVELTKDGTIHLIGIVVDSVSEVTLVNDDQIDVSVSFGMQIRDNFITGMAKTENGVKILLDIDKMISADVVEEVLEADAA
jgi:purine-binding chemotaxis protein CheW